MDQQSRKYSKNAELFESIFGHFSSVMFLLPSMEDEWLLEGVKIVDEQLRVLLNIMISRIHNESEEDDEKLC